jgi:hypothetical protein
MKSLLLTVLLSLLMHCVFAQKSVSSMNECEFFEYIDILQNSGCQNEECRAAKDSFALRSALLKKLETYVTVFASYSIAPMYLEYATDTRGCPEYVTEYSNARSSDPSTARAKVQSGKQRNVRQLIWELTDLNKPNNQNVQTYIAEFEQSFILDYVYTDLLKVYFDSTAHPLFQLPQLTKEYNLTLLADRIDLIDHPKYVYYESYHSQPHFLKGFEMYHDNDVLLIPFSKINQDREYTGGFKFTLITDYLKWRWVRPINNNKKSGVLTYQTISVMGGGYTPYIRYRNNDTLADTLYTYDRPFASYLCFERAKYRTWRHGLIRHRGEFQFGSIGISQGRKIQAKLHEDVIHTSQYVHGWDNQIANGGRLVIQLNHKFEFMLFSSTNRYSSIFRRHSYNVDEPKGKGCLHCRSCAQCPKHGEACRKYTGRNVSFEVDLRAGTIMTTAGAGIRFSTLDFLKQSGNQMIASRGKSDDDFGWKFDIGFNYRYVVHNSLLQGLGFYETFKEDRYDKVKQDPYLLSSDEIERHLFILDYGFNLKWRKTTVFFRHTFHTLEYRSRLEDVDLLSANFVSQVNSQDLQFYKLKVRTEQKSFLDNRIGNRVIYGYGTIGINWIID